MNNFKDFLIQQNLSSNTISAYLIAVHDFQCRYHNVTKRNLLLYKTYLIENYKSKSVNLKIQAVNRYLDFLERSELKLKYVKVQQRLFLENVISDADYTYLKNKLKKDGHTLWYFVVRYLACTGARVSELRQIKIEHVRNGYIDLYTKGGKTRRIYIPSKLASESLQWFKKCGLETGYIFLNRYGQQLTSRGISQQLKNFASKYGINPNVVYPHSFRHRFAKNFLEKCNDIALLADLMGHESIETTRIYLRKTSEEQQKIVNEIITW